jgi:endo-1,4-beta-xylanase
MATSFRLWMLFAASLLLTAGLSGCGDDDATNATSCVPTATSLRCAAASRNLAIGSAVGSPELGSDPTYGEVLAREFNIVTPENDMKWGLIHPERNRYDFAAADAIVQFAHQHRMKVRGHNLAWHTQNPPWLVDGNFGREESISILHEHIQTVVGHYRGQIAEWDVVNEAFDDTGGGRRDTLWQQRIGPDYIELAFRFAHEADPDAKLFYNDFLIEFAGLKFNAVLALATDFKDRGVPIDGVGFQAHAILGVGNPRWFKNLQSNLQQVANLGLDVSITELDVPIVLPTTSDALATQASLYQAAIDACLAVPRCHTFVMWGFTDRYSWIPSTYPGLGDALIFDRSYQPKPAYDALRQRLNKPS